MTPVTASAKEAAAAVVDQHLDELVSLSHSVHSTPELCFHETTSAHAVAEAMRAGGLAGARGRVRPADGARVTGGRRRAGGGGVRGYDALPGVGHACGHNIIAATAVGAGLALAAVADDLGLTVRVLGTPAEEGGGGKVLMLERGAFAGVHAAMMVHPWPTERLTGTCLAVAHYDVSYSGREAHALGGAVGGRQRAGRADRGPGRHRPPAPAAAPRGPGARRGHAAAPAPPTSSRPLSRPATWCARAPPRDWPPCGPRVDACFEAGALATGCSVRYEELSPVYSHMEADPALLQAYRANAEALGRHFEADDDGAPLPTFSTDMANVSLAVPTIHPLIGIETHGAVNHQHEFAAACITPSADAAVRDGAVALAWTAIDAATDPALRARLLGA